MSIWDIFAGVTEEQKIADAMNGSGRSSLLPPPSPDDETIRKKLEEEENKQRKAKGRASTILTGGMGVTAPIPSARKTLLGGV